MCGIFGVINKGKVRSIPHLFRDLFLLSESRGKEAAGFAIKNPISIKVFKTPFPARKLVKSYYFQNEISKSIQDKSNQFIGIGHSRLVTNGYEHFAQNNQPMVKNGMVVIHNGIIVNQSNLWKIYDSHVKESDLDTELIPTILQDQIDKGSDFGTAIGELFTEISGMTNIALLSENNHNLLLATNNGSIYYINLLNNDFFVFASEKYILQQLITKNELDISTDYIQQLNANEVVSINLKSMSFYLTKIGQQLQNFEIANTPTKTEIIKNVLSPKNIYINTSLEYVKKAVSPLTLDLVNERKTKIDNLKRCIKCILPETFPYINFDINGICNYCKNYKKATYKGEGGLMKVADTFRKNKGKVECLVPFSGGRDSSYALHYIVKELKLKPIAFSYDWGMLTDLGRRNQARLCGKLGVEHILISADIRKKRDNIRKNVLAWLKHPNLGTIPLFMAGDKQYFYYANLLMKQNNLNLSVLGENLYETTNFKTGFCGIKPKFNNKHTYSLSDSDKIKMLVHYGKQYLINPAYINSSLFDTIGAFKSYYVIDHKNINIFDYLKWDENVVNSVIINEYEWETDPGTKTTWRIGDGTAAFYNYIYYMLAGFTENDTFRSNQIREGDLARAEALEFVKIENQPRWDSIQWYSSTIGIDFIKTINIINDQQALY